MKLITMMVVLIVSSISFAGEPGFDVGSRLTVTPISGVLTVSCFDHLRSENAVYRCRGRLVEPAQYSYFYGPQEVVADKIVFESTWQDGKIVKKTKGYDNKKHRSKNPVNLATVSLTQAPLLDEGKNQVQYKFMRKGEMVLEGLLEMEMQKAPSKICRDGHTFSYNVSDCRNSGNVCDEYFRKENYCRY